MRNKYYELVVEAKDVVYELFDRYWLDDGFEFLDNVLSKHWNSINEKSALVAVLSCGSVVNDSFMLPATRDVLSSFRYVRSRVSDGKPVYIPYCYDDTVVWKRII